MAADKACDTRDFVQTVRVMQVTPHVSQNVKRSGGSAIDARTTRHAGYQISQRQRPLIERPFGWMKSVGWIRKVKLRGVGKVDWLFVFACSAFNLIRLPKILALEAV